MPEFCTCGTQLPPDARFCHKCGKPQREEPYLLSSEPALKAEALPTATPAPSVSPVGINFRNPLVVRVGLLAGALAFLLGLLPMPFLGRVVLLLGAGFFSVYLYQRRSGQALSVGNGARMGWISGLFCFVIITVLFTVNLVLISIITRDSGVAGFYRGQLGSMGMPEESIEQVIEVFQSPWNVTGLLFSLFLMFTGLLAVGGALAAKVLRRDQSNSTGVGGRL